ncbi:hypothetical protein [Streptantibioticus ferralitis]|uniref:Uncharacterized protein n=1 Tax=Streptantibioticus ferralitis TaxID=236510 RepID=A0ABT5ZC43_9ACTN|nr:hypothetical protein [Streptantibioticus ferralitis]MDF2261412.1 hypothetical protein [Streptantibioticus ferralitis]
MAGVAVGKRDGSPAPDRTGKRIAGPRATFTNCAGATASTTAWNRSNCFWACGVQRTSTQPSETLPSVPAAVAPDAVPVNCASSGAARAAPRTPRRVALIDVYPSLS